MEVGRRVLTDAEQLIEAAQRNRKAAIEVALQGDFATAHKLRKLARVYLMRAAGSDAPPASCPAMGV